MVDFNNSKKAFADKSNFDLNRAYFLFKTISNPLISSILTSSVKFALFLRLPVTQIIKATIYKHFCGGETIIDSNETINKLWKSSIGTILDYSAEGKEKEKDFNNVRDETIKVLRIATDNEKIPFVVFKLTGLIKFNILRKLSKKEDLNKVENLEFDNFKLRITEICNAAVKANKPIFIDAEESWIQNAIDDIVLQLMKKYNNKHVLIYNTLKFYRNDRIDYLKKIIKKAKKENFKLGLKLVRGAYHQQELERAYQNNYEIPVHLKKENTDNDFNLALKICIDNITNVSFCAGTHNEESSNLLIQLMQENGIANNDKRIYSSQLLGMSDNISYNLSKENFNVSKYVPYGPVKDVIPYLIRRAEENASISGQMGRELINIIAEQKRRKKTN